MHKRRLFLNTFSSLLLEAITIICGLILPRLIIRSYGSDVNGLVNSIRQFLSVISFFELGIGAVIKSALYKPLAESDFKDVNCIISSGRNFFKKLGYILSGYIVILIIIYPILSNSIFNRMYISLLIIALSANSFAQYFISCVDGIFLTATQHGYIQSFTQIVTIVLNTVACAFMIKAGFGIHMVQFTTAFIYLIRPIIVRLYIKKHYSINYKEVYEGEPIAQKWNGIAQHIAAIVLEGTDIIVLTIFSTLADVSVYSVYFLVIRGIKQLFLSISGGFQALMGEFYIKQEIYGMRKTFDLMEWFYGTATTFVYGCAVFLIVPFVSVYALNVTDADYNQPLFAVILLLAFWIFNNNLPYHTAILAAGHYRQTQNYFIIAAVINLVLSIAFVNLFGLIGVAIGTFAAMLFQTTWMIVYNVKYISRRSLKLILKQFAVDAMVALIACVLSSFVHFGEMSWTGWIIMSVRIVLIWGSVSLTLNLVFYRKLLLSFLRKGDS